MNYAVVYFPTVPMVHINDFREKYDPSQHTIPPHVTLISPFSTISENQVIQHIETVTKTTNPFQIHLNGLVKSFDDCLFLLVKEGKQEIVKLHEKLYSGILAPYLQNDPPFMPHITLGLFRKKNNVFDKNLYDKAYKEAKKMNIDITCIFNNVSLIQGDGQSPSRVVKTFDF